MNELLQFLSNSTTEYVAAKNLAEMLENNGFTKLDPAEKWNLKNGGCYYVVNGQSALIAFKIGLKFDCGGFNVVSSHLDSPNFKIKPNGLISVDNFSLLNTEVYGGPILESWFDRPLGLAGRVVLKENNKLKSVVVDAKRDLFIIPHIAPHLKKDVVINPQKDLLSLVSLTKYQNTKELISKIFGFEEDKIISFDLSLYSREQAKLMGINNEFINAPRIDNLECAFLSMQAFLNATPTSKTNVYVAFNNEEIGSQSAEGALSTMLHDTLSRIAKSEEEYCQNISNSVMVSADNAHAINPNYLELADPTNRIYMNKGVVIKHNSNKRYTTDAIGDAIITKLCEDNKIPYQHYTNRSDQRGGSTLGSLSITKVSMTTVDIGLAQLAMHSANETAGKEDAQAMLKLLKAFYNSNYRNKNDEIML